MKYDEVLQTLGEFGRYQQIQYFLLCLISIVSAFHSLNMVFVGATPEHWCTIPNATQLSGKFGGNLSNDHLRNLTSPWKQNKFGDWSRDSCMAYNVTEILDDEALVMYNYSSWMSQDVNRTTYACDSWQYSQDVFHHTVVTQFNLVCDQKFILTTAKMLFFAGRLVGAFSVGHLSDRFGRRPVFFIFIALQVIVGCVVAFSPNLPFFLVLYFFQGLIQTGVFLVAYILGTELVGPSYRKVTGFVIQGFYSIGFMLLAGIAYLIWDWKYLEVAISLPGIVLIVIYYWFIPESVRWLVLNDRVKEAEDIIHKAAAVNKVTLPENVFTETDAKSKSEDRKTYTVIDLLKTWRMAQISLNVWLNWLVNGLVYYGLSLNTSNLGGSPYINFMLAGAVEIPAYILCVLLLDRIGRRKLLTVLMVIGGAACVCTPIIDYARPDLTWLSITFAMLGKCGITASYGVIYLLAAEVFPTVVRNIGMGVSSMSSRLGSIIAPLFLHLKDVWVPLPMLLFGAFSVAAGLLALLLPETLGKPLPQTIEDVTKERVGKGKHPLTEDVAELQTFVTKNGAGDVIENKELESGVAV